MINVITEKFNNLNGREQKLVIVAAVLISIVVIGSLIKQSAVLFTKSKGPTVQTRQLEFTKLLPKIQELKKLRQNSVQLSSIPENGLYEFINKNQPKLDVLEKDNMLITQKDNAVEISYKAVSFDDLVGWLLKNHHQYGIEVNYVDISQVPDKSGYVTAKLIVE